MNTLRVSATKARNNFFELLNQVALGTQVVIERDKKEVAVLSSKSANFDWKSFRKAAKAAHGILKGYSIEEISPLRAKGAWRGFGDWDKQSLRDKSLKDLKFTNKK